MALRHVFKTGLPRRATRVFVLCGGLLDAACVNLDRPASLQACEHDRNCTDQSSTSRPDAGRDTQSAERCSTDLSDRREADAPDASFAPDKNPDLTMSPGDLLRPEAAADTVAPTDLVPDLNGLTPDTSDIDVSAGSDVSEDLGGEGPDLASDVPPDVDKGDVGQDLPPDLSKPDVMQAACAAATPVTGGNMIFNTTNALCFVTCDDMQFGWGCSSFNQTAKVDRTVKVNGTNVTCGGTLPAKRQPGNYYYFEVGAGGHTWDLIHWSGSFNSSCPAPTGGFAP